MGFASGDIDRDAFGIRQFAADEHEFIVTQSFAKNMGNLISVYFLLLSIEIILFRRSLRGESRSCNIYHQDSGSYITNIVSSGGIR